jgi:hypothetical protein
VRGQYLKIGLPPNWVQRHAGLRVHRATLSMGSDDSWFVFLRYLKLLKLLKLPEIPETSVTVDDRHQPMIGTRPNWREMCSGFTVLGSGFRSEKPEFWSAQA